MSATAAITAYVLPLPQDGEPIINKFLYEKPNAPNMVHSRSRTQSVTSQTEGLEDMSDVEVVETDDEEFDENVGIALYSYLDETENGNFGFFKTSCFIP